jgi:hypothetical protein
MSDEGKPDLSEIKLAAVTVSAPQISREFTLDFTQVCKCSVLLIKYHSGDQVKKTEMGRTCGTYGGEER